LSSCFTLLGEELRIVAVLSNTSMVGLSLPVKVSENRMEPLSESITKPLYRRIDRGVNLILSNVFNKDIFVVGEDKFLKKYEYPTELFSKLDYKKAASAPVEELKSHYIGTTCWDFSNEIKFMATGGKDGNFFLRNMSYVA
jgi:hypothetical protein